MRNWKALALGTGITLLLGVGLCFPLKRMAARSQVKRVERDQQRHAARQQLKKIFDKIFIEGERPLGKNSPEGETIPIGEGRDPSGGGRWFVLGASYIWAVQNNGRDDDNWVYNNVITDGPGAIGARVTLEAELADFIRATAAAAR